MWNALGSIVVHSGEQLNCRDEGLLKKPKSDDIACAIRNSDEETRSSHEVNRCDLVKDCGVLQVLERKLTSWSETATDDATANLMANVTASSSFTMTVSLNLSMTHSICDMRILGALVKVDCGM